MKDTKKKKCKSKGNKLLVVTLFALLLGIGFIYAISVDWIYPTTDLITNQSQVNLSWWVQNDNMQNLTFSDNGTNYTLYDSSLVLFMNFDNRSALGECFSNATGCVKDLSLYGNNGTLVGNWNATGEVNASNISIGAGKYGNAFIGTGKLGYVSIAHSSNFGTNMTNISWSFWIYRAKSVANTDWIMKYSTAAQRSWRIYESSSSYKEIGLTIANNSLSGTNYVSTNYCGADNSTWTKIDIIYNGTNIIFYKNGIYCDILASTNPFIVNNTQSIYIGGNSVYLNGSIDDVKIWNKTLTSTQILEEYNSQITKYNSTYWQFNNTQNTSTYGKNNYVCSYNATQQICSSSLNVRNVEPLVFNFTNSLGTIRNDFYGINSESWISTLMWIDLNNDGFKETASNYTFYRNALMNAKINKLRISMSLNSISVSEGVFNETAQNSNSGNINTFINLVEYAKENDLKILFIAEGMPSWLADNTTGLCLNSLLTCPPTNHTKWGELVVDFLERVGCDENVCEVEVMNEPEDKDVWLYNVTSRTNGTISVEYNKVYNATYLAIKSIYPNMNVGGTGTTGKDGDTFNILINWMSNFSKQADFVSHHDYLGQGSFTDYYSALNDDYSWIYANMTYYNFSKFNIYIDEYNIWNETLRENYTNIWDKDISVALSTVLNLNSTNMSLMFHTFGGRVNWTYSEQFEMVLEPSLSSKNGNPYRTAYNVTKSFATLCPSGATVYISSNDDNTIKQVSCKKGNMKSIIIINTDNSSAKNITLNLTGSGITSLFNYSNLSQEFTPVADSLNMGILDSYGILYLVEDLQTPTITISSPTASTYTTNSLWFNVTLDEEGSTCRYSLDGQTNVSMTQGGYLASFTDKSLVQSGAHNVTFYCNDTSNNWASASVDFNETTVLLPSGYYKINENNGTLLFDLIGAMSNGIITEAAWVTDGVLNTLTSGSDYSVNLINGLLTVSGSRTYDWLVTLYTYDSGTNSAVYNLQSNFTSGIDQVSGKIPTILLLGIVLTIFGVLALLWNQYKNNGLNKDGEL